jgi:thiamine pyrophosphate-dependent acetolactate synthase large subunit-like protein
VGWGVPAALCAQMIGKGRRVVGVSGDGGMMMGLYCLEMAKHYQLPITYLVLNNSCLGNVRDFQPPARRIATDYPEADFAGIARAVGIEGFKVDKAEDVKPAFNEALNSNKPSLVEVRVDDAPHFRLIGT